MSEQPTGPGAPKDPAYEAARLHRAKLAYRLATASITARADKKLQRELIQAALDDMPQDTGADLQDVARMLSVAVMILTEVVRATAEALDRFSGDADLFDRSFRAGIRTDMLDD